MGIRHRAVADSRNEANPRQLGSGWLGTRPSGSGSESGESGGLLQAPDRRLTMSAVEATLLRLSLPLPEVAAPIAAYVPAVRTGNLVFTSGQLPTIDGTLISAGKVGAEVTVEQAKAAAERAALNGLAAIKQVIGDLDKIVRIVKVVGFVAVDPSFTNHSAVVNGASELLAECFGDAAKHARSSVGMASLPLNAPVEIELIVEVRD